MNLRAVVVVAALVAAVGLSSAMPDKSYLNGGKSEEIDSDEFGQFRGPKRTSCDCGWTNKASGRIVGGKEARLNEFPYTVGYGEIHPDFPKVEDVAISCGGTLVTGHHVVTAAHCTFGDHELRTGIVVGEHDETRVLSKYRKVYAVAKMIEHEGWTLKTFKNDIAILFIKEEIVFNAAVGPACLPTQRPDIIGKHVKLTGWGEVQSKKDNPHVLRKVNLRVIKLDHCREAYPHQKIDLANPTQLCTYSKNKDSCQGDSGGPLAWLDPETNRYTLVGVVSFSKACADKDPGINTDVFAYLGWIQDKIKKTAPAKTCSKV